MATASAYLLAISSAASGSTVSAHLLSARARLELTGCRVEMDVETSTTQNMSAEFSSNTVTMDITNTSATLETNAETLTMDFC